MRAMIALMAALLVAVEPGWATENSKKPSNAKSSGGVEQRSANQRMADPAKPRTLTPERGGSGSAARTPSGGLEANSALARDAQQARNMQGLPDRRDAMGRQGVLGHDTPTQLRGQPVELDGKGANGRDRQTQAGGGNPMTRLGGNTGGQRRGAGLSGPSAESNENAPFVTGAVSGSSPRSEGYLPGVGPQQRPGGGDSRNDNKPSGEFGGGALGTPAGPGGRNDAKPGGGLGGVAGGSNNGQARGAVNVGGRQNENKPLGAVAGNAPKPADNKPQNDKPADKPQDKPKEDKPKEDKPQDKPQAEKPQGEKPKDGDKPDKTLASSTPAEERGGGGVSGPRFGGAHTHPGREGAGTGASIGPRVGLGNGSVVNPGDGVAGGGTAGARMQDRGKLVNPGGQGR